MTGNLTVGTLLGASVQALQAASPTPHLDAELLLAHTLATDRTRLKSHPERGVTAGEAARHEDLIRRRAAGEPLAYLVGYRDFWTLRLAVSPAVLVPRPETELLVERALALAPQGGVRVADLGTGSGAIALALAKERPDWRIAGVELSTAALQVARRNAQSLGLAVEWLQGRWFEPLAHRRFELLISNPPYVAADDPALRQPALMHEPQLALASGPQGLDALHAIIDAAPQHLERGGWLLLEHGATQAEQLARHLVARGFAHVRCHRDLARHDRMTEAQHP